MEVKKCIKQSFVVIGKEGSTNDGNGFIQKLWSEANSHFNEIVDLVKKDEKGRPLVFGEQCLILLIRLNHGKIILVRVCI